VSVTVKQELYRWVETLRVRSMTTSEINLVGLIIEHFEVLAPLGTANGQRARKFVQLFRDARRESEAVLPQAPRVQASGSVSFDKISRLEIGPFRGFSAPEVFAFEKKHAFLYGPNGSGKSSFFEGLEYALLGEVSEASAKRFAVEDYVRNTTRNTYVTPRVVFSDATGVDSVFESNPARYRFAFVEKNRIEAFARIPSATPSEQRDRIATLFGLDNFNDFVNGFSDNLEAYVSLDPRKALDFAAEEQKQVARLERLKEIEEKIKGNQQATAELVSVFAETEVSTSKQLLDLLLGEDRISGRIKTLEGKKATKIPDDFPTDAFTSLAERVTSISSLVTEATASRAEIVKMASEVDYKLLFDAVVAIGARNKRELECCPACDTPLTRVTKNPFEKAEAELKNLAGLASLQEDFRSTSNLIVSELRELSPKIEEANNLIATVNSESLPLPMIQEIQPEQLYQDDLWLSRLQKELTDFLGALGAQEPTSKAVQVANLELEGQREQLVAIDGKLQEFRALVNELLKMESGLAVLQDERKSTLALIESFGAANQARLEEIEVEKAAIARDLTFLESYTKIVRDLKDYRDRLPLSLSAGLSQRVKDFYNVVNSHDPPFEHLEGLKLPVSPGEKILLTFKGASGEENAMKILSEGHLKIVGLSILLAKAVAENVGFIIFDDIVNAIDDDHRSGVADLLIDHPSLVGKQLIVTCHGEQFISKLEHKLGPSRTSQEVKGFRFTPPDTLTSRGVRVVLGETKHYILRAKSAFEENNLKESAGLCRQAIESLTTVIWKKLEDKLKVSISVLMRTPTGTPDLASVVDGIRTQLKKLGPNSEIYEALSELKAKYNWNLLNKGTHEQEGLPEFERSDVSGLLQLVTRLDELSRSFSVSVALSPDVGMPE